MLDPPAPVIPETAPGIDECGVKIEVPAAKHIECCETETQGGWPQRQAVPVKTFCSRNFQEQFVRASVGFQVG